MKKRYLIGFCGHLDRQVAGENGQTLKTVSLLNELHNLYGENNVFSTSTHIWKKRPITLLFRLIKMSFTCKNIVVLPDQNGIRIVIPLFRFLSLINHNVLIYCVVGAWLAEKLEKHKFLKRACSKLRVILVETSTLQRELGKIGIENTDILKNFKELKKVKLSKKEYKLVSPVKCCFFSRVVEMKGIEDAISVVKRNNAENEKKIILDIYGPIDEEYYKTLMRVIGDDLYISYKGQANAFESVDIIKKYSYQFFPTRFKTEGIPGSVIDSFYAAVPVIASRWNSFMDIIVDGENGILFDICDVDDFYKKTIYAIGLSDSDYTKLKKSTLKYSSEYSSAECVKVLIKYIED